MDKSLSTLNRSSRFHFGNEFWANPQPYEEIALYQIGDLYCNGGYEIGEHIQECYEISYIVSGEGYYFTNGESYKVKKGDIHICLPYQKHNYIADDADPFRFFYLGFDFLDYSKELNLFYHVQKMFHHAKYPVAQDKHGLYQLFTGIFKEIINGKDYSPIMIKSFLNQIIVLTYRNFFDEWQDEYNPETSFTDSNTELIYQIINYIDMNLLNVKSLSVIGEELGYSYCYLSHIFSEEIGLTIQEYYNQKRFEKAIKFLKEGELTITGIAQKLNYSSVHTFSRAFKKKIGVSPMQYQEIYRDKINSPDAMEMSI